MKFAPLNYYDVFVAAQDYHIPVIINASNEYYFESCKALRNASRIDRLSRLPARLGSWARRLGPNFGSRGTKLVEFDSTKEGPPGRRSTSTPPRPPLDLFASYHTTSTVEERTKSQKLLRDWLVEQVVSDLETLALNLDDLNRTLAEWIQHCYDNVIALGTAINNLL